MQGIPTTRLKIFLLFRTCYLIKVNQISDFNIDFSNEAICVVPITKYSFSNKEILGMKLDHGFDDVGNFFPTWQGFLERSTGKMSGYKNYMAYLLCKQEDNRIIGVLGVQLDTYESLISKVYALSKEINIYLYLSWIALDQKYQQVNYFALLFEFYHTLIRRLQRELGTRIGGAAIAIRRTRPILWNLLNTGTKCPIDTGAPIYQETSKITFVLYPSEMIEHLKLEPAQDHVLILFKSTRDQH